MRRPGALMRRTAPVWVFALFVIGTVLAAEPMKARLDGDRLKVAAPSLRFLVDAPLDHLHNGIAVTFRLRLGLRDRPGVSAAARVDTQRCSVSYDLWEEKFAVTHVARTPSSVSHLSARAAEAWCVDKLSLSIAGLATEESFWIRLEFVEESREEQNEDRGPFGLALGSLIDIFSRPDREQLLLGRQELGPVRLGDLRQEPGRQKGS